MHVKTGTKRIISWGIPLLLLLLVWCLQASVAGAEWYARHIYPALASVLSWLSSPFPFPLNDLFIFLAVTGILAYLFYALIRWKKAGKRVLNVLRFLMWVYVWFYLAWGLNYSRMSFFSRGEVQPVKFEADAFRYFLQDYVSGLNEAYRLCYTPAGITQATREEVQDAAVAGYQKLSSRFAMAEPQENMRAKPMLFSCWMSRVGVLGSMGPFFAEYTLNREMPEVQYPASYVHEMAHRLGIANEAEASFYAYLICTEASEPTIRYSGYLNILGYVLSNARRLLGNDEYTAFRRTIEQGIVEEYLALRAYWDGKYSKRIGAWQEKIYNLYLKGNNIPSGTRNYAEVIALIMAWREAE